MLLCKTLHCTGLRVLGSFIILVGPFHLIPLPKPQKLKNDDLPQSYIQHHCRHHSRPASYHAQIYSSLAISAQDAQMHMCSISRAAP